jgi:hypothetical protein
MKKLLGYRILMQYSCQMKTDRPTKLIIFYILFKFNQIEFYRQRKDSALSMAARKMALMVGFTIFNLRN